MTRHHTWMNFLTAGYVLYSDAQARIEALEWLVEVQDFNPLLEWIEGTKGKPTYYGPQQRRAGEEYAATVIAARAAAGV